MAEDEKMYPIPSVTICRPHLRNLKIKGFWDKADLSLEFSEGINVIMAPCMSGKSRIYGAVQALYANKGIPSRISWDNGKIDGEFVGDASRKMMPIRSSAPDKTAWKNLGVGEIAMRFLEEAISGLAKDELLVVDDFNEFLDNERTSTVLRSIRTAKCQAILTTVQVGVPLTPGTKVFDLGPWNKPGNVTIKVIK